MLGTVWLPAERREAAAIPHLYKMFCRASDKDDEADFKALSQGYSALLNTHRETVQHITKRGGLLHVGCAA